MGIIDAFTRVADNLSVLTGVVATDAYDASKTDIVANQKGLALGEPIVAHLQVTEAYGGGTGSLVLPIMVASNVPTLDGASLLYLMQLGGGTPFSGFVASEMTLGAEFAYPVPSQIMFDSSGLLANARERRYYGFYFIVTGTYLTGKWSVNFGAHKGPSVARLRTIGYAGP